MKTNCIEENKALRKEIKNLLLINTVFIQNHKLQLKLIKFLRNVHYLLGSNGVYTNYTESLELMEECKKYKIK